MTMMLIDATITNHTKFERFIRSSPRQGTKILSVRVAAHESALPIKAAAQPIVQEDDPYIWHYVEINNYGGYVATGTHESPNKWVDVQLIDEPPLTPPNADGTIFENINFGNRTPRAIADGTFGFGTDDPALIESLFNFPQIENRIVDGKFQPDDKVFIVRRVGIVFDDFSFEWVLFLKQWRASDVMYCIIAKRGNALFDDPRDDEINYDNHILAGWKIDPAEYEDWVALTTDIRTIK